MKFVRQFKGGGADYDPRQKTYAVFICSVPVCGYEENVDITANSTFNFSQDRLCPKCKCHGENDRIDNLRAEIDRLTKNKNSIEIQIEKIERELIELNSKKNC